MAKIRMWSAGKVGSSGFTLIEMLVVLVILSLAAVAIVPALDRGLEVNRFRSQVHDLVLLLSQTRAEAIRNNRPRRIELVASRDSAAGSSSVLPQLVGIEITSPHSVRINSSLAVAFYPDGSATAVEIRLSRDNQRAALMVDPLTGRIHVDLNPES